MFRTFLYDGPTNSLRELDENSLFSCKLKSDGQKCGPLEKVESFLWLDACDITPDELDALEQRFHIDPHILEDIRGHEGRPKLHEYEGYIHIVFHALELKGEGAARCEIEDSEIDCLLAADWVVTLHQSTIPAFEDIGPRWKRNPDWMEGGPAQLLYELMDAVLDDYFPLLDKLDAQIDEFENRLFEQSQDYRETTRPLSSDIFALKRALLEIRHIAAPTRDVANTLMRRASEAGRHHFAAFQDLYDHSSRIVENIDTYRDILSGALDAYLAIESNRMNAIMKNLTAYSIILLLPTLIAGIYGMNFDDLPKHHGFYGSLSAMVLIVAFLVFYFKRKSWL